MRGGGFEGIQVAFDAPAPQWQGLTATAAGAPPTATYYTASNVVTGSNT